MKSVKIISHSQIIRRSWLCLVAGTCCLFISPLTIVDGLSIDVGDVGLIETNGNGPVPPSIQSEFYLSQEECIEYLDMASNNDGEITFEEYGAFIKLVGALSELDLSLFSIEEEVALYAYFNFAKCGPGQECFGEDAAIDLDILTPADRAQLCDSIVSWVNSEISDITTLPSGTPSNFPTKTLSKEPTKEPTVTKSGVPTKYPSSSQSSVPSKSPTKKEPTSKSTKPPTKLPSELPTRVASDKPTNIPSTSTSPSDAPNKSPTGTSSSESPSSEPSRSPTISASNSPSIYKSRIPSNSPTKKNSQIPSKSPTTIPTVVGSTMPSDVPSNHPSDSPSVSPTKSPTRISSESPSIEPSIPPSKLMSSLPSTYPSKTPSNSPTKKNSQIPSNSPSRKPSSKPSKLPTLSTSDMLSGHPSNSPSVKPTILPTVISSENPSSEPTKSPTTTPPTAYPTLNGDVVSAPYAFSLSYNSTEVSLEELNNLLEGLKKASKHVVEESLVCNNSNRRMLKSEKPIKAAKEDYGLMFDETNVNNHLLRRLQEPPPCGDNYRVQIDFKDVLIGQCLSLPIGSETKCVNIDSFISVSKETAFSETEKTVMRSYLISTMRESIESGELIKLMYQYANEGNS